MKQHLPLNNLILESSGSVAVIQFYQRGRNFLEFLVLVDLDKQSVIGTLIFPMSDSANVSANEYRGSVINCKFSPDSSKLAILCYRRDDSNQPFQYDLVLFDAQTCDVEQIVNCNIDVPPCFAFDPRYKSTRVAIIYFRLKTNSDEEGGEDRYKNGIVTYCLKSGGIVSQCSLVPMLGGFCSPTFSKDGRYLIVQKSGGNSVRVCTVDFYMFDASTLQLIKHFSTNLQHLSYRCSTNFQPNFSSCGTLMSVVSMKTDTTTNDEDCREKQYMSVYRFPISPTLQEQCRVIIVRTLLTTTDVHKLPLPNSLKNFLMFQPIDA